MNVCPKSAFAVTLFCLFVCFINKEKSQKITTHIPIIRKVYKGPKKTPKNSKT